YHVPSQPFHIEVKVLAAVQVSDLLDDLTVGPKQVRQLSRSFYKIFDEELS
ncbi:1-acyl-sn-glycerol-3-phosphate acyltransferase, partial [Acinetobacter baumannii]|nr:1-acyl-sn-glycerol-3-phosphate acyltransferase [Acinetobacter baumannii]